MNQGNFEVNQRSPKTRQNSPKVNIDAESRQRAYSGRDRTADPKLCETYAHMSPKRKSQIRRSRNASAFVGVNGEKDNKRTKIIKQIFFSCLIFAAVFGIQTANFPLADKATAGIKYLLTTETDFGPAFQKVIKNVEQFGSDVKWPMLQFWQQGDTKPVITKLPNTIGMRLPISGEVTKPFGWVMDPKKHLYSFHTGIDIKVEGDSEVNVVQGGIVETVYTDELGKKCVLVRHDELLMTQYINLSEIEVLKGEQVTQGQVIGQLTTQESGQANLHFEVIKAGKPVDPLSVIGF